MCCVFITFCDNILSNFFTCNKIFSVELSVYFKLKYLCQKQSQRKEGMTHLISELQLLKIDGLPNIIRSKYKTLTLAWTLVLVLSASTCLWLILSTIEQYSAHRVTTSIRRIHEEPAVFPLIALCNMNPFNTDYAASLFTSYNVSFNPQNDTFTSFAILQEKIKQATGSYLTDQQVRNMSSFTHMLIDCLFQWLPCDESDFDYFYHQYLSGCYVFNLNKSVSVSGSGSGNALKIRLYSGLPDLLAASTIQRGYYVIIMNGSDYPYPVSTNLMYATPGGGIILTPTRSIFHQYPAPYSSCTVLGDGTIVDGYEIADRTLFDAVLASGYVYSQATCFLFCEQVKTVEWCGCLSPYAKYTIAGYHFCSNETELKCNDAAYIHFYAGDLIKNECVPKCPLECEQSVVDTVSSSYTFSFTRKYVDSVQTDATMIAKWANQSDFNTSLASNIVIITVFYPSLTYIMVEEEPKMTFENLIGELGGHLHLFLGMSLLSFLELFEFILLLIISMAQKNEKTIRVNQKVHTQPKT